MLLHGILPKLMTGMHEVIETGCVSHVRGHTGLEHLPSPLQGRDWPGFASSFTIVYQEAETHLSFLVPSDLRDAQQFKLSEGSGNI